MQSSKGLRITYKPTRPNPLFHDWLEELHQEAQEKNSKLEPMLREALDSISKYPLPLKSGSECAILKGFDTKLCIFIDKRLEVYKENYRSFNNKQVNSDSSTSSKFPEGFNNQESSTKSNKPKKCLQNVSSSSINEDNNKPTSINECNSSSRSSCESNSTVTSSKEIKSRPGTSKAQNNKKEKIYKPSFRSGGYAILLALLEYFKECPNKSTLDKERVIELAQKYCEESFTRPKPDTLYTAWSNMNRLISKGLVVKSRNKKVQYSLTNQGLKIAEELLKEAAVTPTVNDIIFNNDIVLEDGGNLQNDEKNNNYQANSTNESSSTMLAGSFVIILLI